jgi:hypothetical protein
MLILVNLEAEINYTEYLGKVFEQMQNRVGE